MNKERRRLCWEIWITAALVSSDLFRRLGGRHAQARFTVDNKFRRVVAPVLLAIMLSFTCSLRVQVMEDLGHWPMSGDQEDICVGLLRFW